MIRGHKRGWRGFKNPLSQRFENPIEGPLGGPEKFPPDFFSRLLGRDFCILLALLFNESLVYGLEACCCRWKLASG
jgi:hypothetical protein